MLTGQCCSEECKNSDESVEDAGSLNAAAATEPKALAAAEAMASLSEAFLHTLHSIGRNAQRSTLT
jgi:hypothetical protein